MTRVADPRQLFALLEAIYEGLIGREDRDGTRNSTAALALTSANRRPAMPLAAAR